MKSIGINDMFKRHDFLMIDDNSHTCIGSLRDANQGWDEMFLFLFQGTGFSLSLENTFFSG